MPDKPNAEEKSRNSETAETAKKSTQKASAGDADLEELLSE